MTHITTGKLLKYIYLWYFLSPVIAIEAYINRQLIKTKSWNSPPSYSDCTLIKNYSSDYSPLGTII